MDKKRKASATLSGNETTSKEWESLVEQAKAHNSGRAPEEIEAIIDEALAWARRQKKC